MTRTEAVAQAIADELRGMSEDINRWPMLRSMHFDVRLKPGTTTVRAVIIRSEFEHVLVKNGD